ncbi:triacylglycerol lipase [Maricurvus nonylphenolicus]|uniref:esterase/lipase family protein n=1 Tax=Maricurvus nonylphenolicus TaxID=1008307 RepID=UPI0036F427E6
MKIKESLRSVKRIVTSVISISCLLIASHGNAWFFSYTGYTETRYPIVLVHGFGGFDSIGDLLDYFHKISYNLERSGATVYTAQLSPFNDSEVTGQQLADYLVNHIPAEKVNLFAHSQGAPTARVAATFAPDRIASITSIDGANKGSPVLDILHGLIPPGSHLASVAGPVLDGLGSLLALVSGGDAKAEQDALAGIESLTIAGAADLNTRHGWGVNTQSACGKSQENIDVFGHNIKMYSWVGTDATTNVFDISDALLKLTSLAFNGEANDGLISQCSQYMGQVIYDNRHMNHLDAANQVLGVSSLWLDPVSLYRAHANRLKSKNL